MTKKQIFISSVQSEFAEERKHLAEYIRQDALFSRYFELLLFENYALRKRSDQAYYLTDKGLESFVSLKQSCPHFLIKRKTVG